MLFCDECLLESLLGFGIANDREQALRLRLDSKCTYRSLEVVFRTLECWAIPINGLGCYSDALERSGSFVRGVVALQERVGVLEPGR